MSSVRSKYFVCYKIHLRDASGTDRMSDLKDSVVDVIEPDNPARLPGALKESVHPSAAPDPSDGFKGRCPDDVVLVNFIKLSPRQPV